MTTYEKLGLQLDLTNWEKLNRNLDRIASDIDNISNAAFDLVVNSAKLIWLEPVGTFTELTTTYPNAVEGNASMSRDTGVVYRFDGVTWMEIQGIDPTAINEVDSRLTLEIASKSPKKKTDGVVSITEFEQYVLNKGTINEDWKDAFQEAVDFIKTENVRLVFPAGIYRYSVSPNWAVDDAHITSDGEVRLRYTGTDHAVIIDGVTGANQNVWNMTFGRFIVEAPSTAKDGAYINRVHHSKFDLRVRGAGTAYAGINVLFTVCDIFDVEVSSNPEGWYLDSKPFIGLRLSKFSEGLIPSYNTFLNPVIEHSIHGGKIEGSLGNVFVGGTMEGCDDIGLWLTEEAGLNKFYGLDLEANDGLDVYCQGFQTEFYGLDSTKMVEFGNGAKDNKIFGGSFKSINLTVGTTRNVFSNISYNRELFDGTNGTLTNGGVKNRFSNVSNIKGNSIGIVETVSLNGNWATSTLLNSPMKVVVDGDGFVNLFGTISSPNDNEAISGYVLFTLPIGRRPIDGILRFSVYNNGAIGVIQIDPDTGEVRLITGSKSLLSFNGIRFRA